MRASLRSRLSALVSRARVRAGKHYCPRMATMNKPTYAAIMTYSPDKPVLVFVSSRRQTRLTALGKGSRA